jgi:tetratricopeptide (TPR) repeat protein
MPSKAPSPAAPRGVYADAPRSRAKPSARKPSGAMTGPMKGHGNPAGEKMFWNSMRTMLLVLLGMGGMLFGAYVLGKRMWQLKQKGYNREVALAIGRFKDQDKSRGGALDPNIGKMDFERGLDEQLSAQRPVVEFDTERVRKAAQWARMARAALSERQTVLAVERFRQSLEIWPHQPQVWRELGELYLQLTDLPQAKNALQRAAESDPSNVSVLVGLGEVYLREQNIGKAREMLEAAREINPLYERTYFLLGKAQVAEKDNAGAMEYFEKYLGFRPNDAEALLAKARLQGARREYTQALETLRRAIVVEPESAELYFQAAAAAALMNKIDDAIRYLEKGEMFTNPQAAFKVYQSPAFDLIRKSDIGKLYESELADRARRLIEQSRESGRG